MSGRVGNGIVTMRLIPRRSKYTQSGGDSGVPQQGVEQRQPFSLPSATSFSTVTPKRRRRKQATFESLEARYLLDSTVVFNELLYHGQGEDSQEWVELHNQMAVDMDISGWSIRDAVDFEFPDGTIIPGGGYLVVANDPTPLREATGFSNIMGPLEGRLSNGGETVQLLNNSQRVMDELDYEDRDRWPPGADGSGATLAKKHPLFGTADVNSWTTSVQLGGTPGQANFPTGAVPRVTTQMISTTTSASFLVPRDESLANSWKDSSYVEGSLGETWTPVSTSVGFENKEAASYEATVLADNPLAYWRFGETQATEAAVNAGRLGAAANGTYSVDAGLGTPSLVNTVNDSSITVKANDSEATVSTTGFEKYAETEGIGGTGRSLEFWISLETLPNSIASLVGDGEGALDFGLMVYLTENGRLQTLLRTTQRENFGITVLQTDRALTLGDSTHVVATWDQPSGQVSIYLDGQPAATTLVDGSLPNPGAARNTTNAFFVGRDKRNAGSFEAQIDEVAVYNYALSSTQAAAHFGTSGESITGQIETDVGQSMQFVGSSAYLRVPFEVSPSLNLDQLSLTMRYDDGFVAYLNGVEIVRRNSPPEPLTHQSRASQPRELGQVLAAETIDLGDSIPLLQTGENLLAIHGLNSNVADGTFLIQTQLIGSGFPKQENDLPRLVLNEISGVEDDAFRVELQNIDTQSLSLQEIALAVDGDSLKRVELPAAELGAGEYFVLDQTQIGFRPQPGDRLYLLTSDGRRLVDAQRVEEYPSGRSPAHEGEWLTPSEMTFGSNNQFEINDQIVINEIMYQAPPISYADPNQGVSYVPSEEEWIELYNRGTSTVDLSGWQLQDAIRFEFPAGAELGPNEYLVIAKRPEELAAKHPNLASSILGDYSGRLNDRHEQIRLVDTQLNPVDQVHYYDGGRWPEFADGRGSSLELIDPNADNAKAEAWAASDESLRSEWKTYSYSGPAVRPSRSNFPSTFSEFSFGLLDAGELLIDDVQVIEDPGGASLPFIQNADFEAGLDKWRPVGTHHGEVIVDPANPDNSVFHLTATGPEEHLQNHVETTLKNGNTYERVRRNEEYSISFRAKWLGGSPQLNTRLFFNYLPRTTILETPTKHGTPGAENTRRVINAGPTYTNLLHEPLAPTSGQAVTVSVDATDPSGISGMTLWYSVDDGVFQSVSMSSTSTKRYLATIPGQASGRRVQFYVQGVDAEGAESHFPAAGKDSRALYQVGQRSGSTTGLHELQIIMTDADEDRLGARTNLMSNDRIGATVIYEDQVVYDVGVRLKGSEHGRPDPNRRGFSLRFHPDQLFRGVHETISIDRSGGWRFGRTFGQDEILIYHFFNRAGQIPGMYSDLIYVDGPTVRSGTAILQMARYNDVFLDSQFDDGSAGTAYEYELIYAMQESAGRESLKAAQEGPSVVGISPGTDLGDEKEFYRHYFLIENNRRRDDYQPIISLARTLSKRGEEFDRATQEVLDVDQWMRAFAALSLSGAGDNFNAGSQHNALFYQRPSDDKMLLFPFDMDFAFIQSPSTSLASNADLNRLRRNPNSDHAFLGHLHDIVSTSFNREYMERWVEHYSALLPGQNFSSILSWIGQRASYVRRQLPDEVDFTITSGDQSVSTLTTTVEGRGWINVRELRLANSRESLPLQWLDTTRWQATVPLRFGEQELQLEAIDFQGNLIGTDTVKVSSSAADFNANGQVDGQDIDLLCGQIRLAEFDPRFDLNADSLIDHADFERLIQDVLETGPGDANLDGQFDSSDLVHVFQEGIYEDDVEFNAGWSQGDWNCDGDFTSRDLVEAFQHGGYVSAAIPGGFRSAAVAAAVDAVLTLEEQADEERKPGRHSIALK